MTAITIKNFGGMVPRIAPELLPEGAAAFANNCDFNLGVLGGLKKGLPIFGDTAPNMTAKIRGMYTYNGTHWYTWPTFVQAYKGPVVNDSYYRIYYVEGAVLFSATLPEHAGAGFTPDDSFKQGGVPTLKVLAGVPNPTVAPVLTLTERTTLADYPTVNPDPTVGSPSFTFRTWWSDGVNQMDTMALVPAMVSGKPFRRYSFAPPTPTAGAIPVDTTPVLVVEATLKDPATGTTLFLLNTAGNSTSPATSAALPGGVEMSLELGTTNYINFLWGVTDTRAYISTVTNQWNEESGPSPAALISPTYLQDVNVRTTKPSFTSPAGPPTGGALYRNYQYTTVYRTFGTQAYLKVGTVVGSDSNPIFVDVLRVLSSVGTALISLDWQPPPIWIGGFVALPNGWFAAFRDNILYMSEPYRPHTWQYSITFPTAITGICAGPQALVVATTSSVYNVIGPHPASVNQVELDVAVGGCSQEGMTRVTGGVAVVTGEGILVVQGSTASLELSQQFWTRTAWQEKYKAELSTMMLGYHDGCLVASAWNDPTGFMLRMDETAGALTEFESVAPDVDVQYTSLVRLPLLDALYYATWDGTAANTRICQFAANSTFFIGSWASKQNVFPSYVKFGAGFMRYTVGTTGAKIRLQLYADGIDQGYTDYPADVSGTTENNNTTQNQFYFRLKPHVGARRWQVALHVTNGAKLREIALAQDMGELQGV